MIILIREQNNEVTSSLRHFVTSSLRHFVTSSLRHFVTSSLRHASRLGTLIGLALACATANAALIINVEGVRGSGKTTWTLSGSSTTGRSSTIGTSTDNRARTYGGWLRFAGSMFVSETSLNNRAIFTSRFSHDPLLAVTGSPKLTIGSEERDITHLNILRIQVSGNRYDSGFWFRVNRELFYRGDVNSSWSGSFTLDFDISNFKIGTFSMNNDTHSFAKDFAVTFKETTKTTPKPPTIVEPTSVPEPSSLALLGLALAGLRFSRKLKGAQSRA